mmetsp:Transcript_22998/g.62431  ORF Transcript_22998/g.62431 Transcript_22998/m.62431 type:complete len:206 (-) Transcript_22998:463-1080(-)
MTREKIASAGARTRAEVRTQPVRPASEMGEGRSKDAPAAVPSSIAHRPVAARTHTTTSDRAARTPIGRSAPGTRARRTGQACSRSSVRRHGAPAAGLGLVSSSNTRTPSSVAIRRHLSPGSASAASEVRCPASRTPSTCLGTVPMERSCCVALRRASPRARSSSDAVPSMSMASTRTHSSRLRSSAQPRVTSVDPDAATRLKGWM